MIALGKNHATKHSVRLTVVIVRVFHASLLSHFLGSSGSQVTSQSPRLSNSVFMRKPHPFRRATRCCRIVRGIFGSTSSRSPGASRSEEHTSELQSRGHLVCR